MPRPAVAIGDNTAVGFQSIQMIADGVGGAYPYPFGDFLEGWGYATAILFEGDDEAVDLFGFAVKFAFGDVHGFPRHENDSCAAYLKAADVPLSFRPLPQSDNLRLVSSPRPARLRVPCGSLCASGVPHSQQSDPARLDVRRRYPDRTQVLDRVRFVLGVGVRFEPAGSRNLSAVARVRGVCRWWLRAKKSLIHCIILTHIYTIPMSGSIVDNPHHKAGEFQFPTTSPLI